MEAFLLNFEMDYRTTHTANGVLTLADHIEMAERHLAHSLAKEIASRIMETNVSIQGPDVNGECILTIKLGLLLNQAPVRLSNYDPQEVPVVIFHK